MTTSRLEKCLDQWYTQIEDTLDKHCPKRRNKPKDVNNLWWTSKLQKQRKEHKKANFSKPNRNKELLKEKKDCLRAKMQDWRDFNTKQDSTESMNTLRKILEKWENNSSGVLEKPDGRATDPSIDTLEFLM